MGFEQRARWLASQIGHKPGRRTSEDLLLGVEDLAAVAGGRWKQTDQRTWRTGGAHPDAGWASRARERRSTTAWRSYQNKSESRWLWCQVVPLASPADVGAAAADIADKALPNRGAKVKLVASRDLDPPSIEHAVFLFGREQATAGKIGEAGSYLIGFGVGSVLAVAAYSGTNVNQDQAVAIAGALGRRIHDRTGTETRETDIGETDTGETDQADQADER